MLWNRYPCSPVLIHISEPTRPLYISYAVFCLKKKNINKTSSDFHILDLLYMIPHIGNDTITYIVIAISLVGLVR